MRKDPFVNDQYYHIYNRGVDKRDIFNNKDDVKRFLLSIKEFNVKEPVKSLKETLKNKTDVQKLKDIEQPLISIVCYCINPNHFHFIVKQEADDGISEFFKRLLGGYTLYFNSVYKRSGALFQGRFKSVLIDREDYFLKIRPYVNVNYLVHNIPIEKSELVVSSCEEYDNLKFELVSKKEAINLLEFYGSNKKFKSECLNVINMIREDRELESIIFEN